MTQYVFTSESQDVDAIADAALNALNGGSLEAAERLYRRAITLRPRESAFHNNCGVAVMRLGRLEEAEREFRVALELNRQYPDALVNLASVLIKREERRGLPPDRAASSPLFAEAEQALQDALRIGGERLDAIMLLALVLERLQRQRASVETLKRARPLHPDPTTLAYLTSSAAAKMHDWSTAAELLERVAQTQPSTVDQELRLGEYYGRLGQRDLSRAHFRNGAKSVGDSTALRWKELGYTPVYFESTADVDEYWRALENALDEALAEAPVFDWRALPIEGFVPPFQLAHLNRCCRSIKEKYARLFAPSFQKVRVERARRSARAKLRVGYYFSPLEIGGFLRSMAGIINRLDPSRFESIVFHHPESESFLRSQLNAVSFVNLSDSFETAVERIRETDCDAIYYWKVGATNWNYYLPMMRLAPTQVVAWGAHGTTGTPDVDYFLSYRLAEIESAQEHYTEKLVLLNEAPEFQARHKPTSPSTRVDLGLPSDGALYFCQQRLAKYHPEFDDYIKGVLVSDPSGYVMTLLGDPDDGDAERIRARIVRKLGATLAKRMIFLPRLSLRDYDKILSASTVVLDSSVYSGCLTLYDALSRGIPCVSKVGELLVQRFPVSAYAAMGVDRAPLANNCDEYVRNAVELGVNHDRRRALSQLILERNPCVFERVDAVREFEQFLERALREER